jgi:hypothetical protein
MEDDLKNYCKWKTTSIFLVNVRRPKKNCNWKMTKHFCKWKTTSKEFVNGRQPQKKCVNGKRTQKNVLMEDDLKTLVFRRQPQ